MSSIEEVKAQINAARDVVSSDVVGMLSGAEARFEDARAMVMAAIEGSANNDAWEAVGHFDRVHEELGGIQTSILTLAQTLEEIVGQM